MLKKLETKNSLKTLKNNNRILVLSYMRNTGSVSVNEISRATQLSKMTVHKIIEHYLDSGMVQHTGKGDSTDEGGKRPNLFAFDPNYRYIYAVRLADRVLDMSLVNLRGEMVGAQRQVTLGTIGFEEAMLAVRSTFDALSSEHRLDPHKCLAVVVGCNGIVDVENGVCLVYYQMPGWGPDLPVGEYLGKLFPGSIPVRVDSWWRHLAHGEIQTAHEPAARRRFFLVGNSGDYVSGGMVADGKVLTGATGFAGEVGHMVVNPDATEVCICGGTGCLQAMVAPSRVVAAAEDRRREYPNSGLFGKRSRSVDFASIARASNQADELACALMDRAAGNFAVAINNIVQICDPGTVVLFGDYARAGDFFLGRLKRKVNGMTICGVDKRTRIECSSLDDRQGLVGAAHLMADSLFVV